MEYKKGYKDNAFIVKMELVAFIGSDKENWGQIKGLINHGEWDKIIIVRNKNSDEFIDEKGVMLEVDSEKKIIELKEEMMNKLKEKISGDLEVSLSLASGNGKEHMALIASLINIPVGIKLVVFTQNGLDFIT